MTRPLIERPPRGRAAHHGWPLEDRTPPELTSAGPSAWHGPDLHAHRGRSGRCVLDDLRMDPSLPQVSLALWRADAVVLFDWLMSVDLNAVPITHPAEKQALMDLLTRLEETDVTGVTQEEIDSARDQVARDIGW